MKIKVCGMREPDNIRAVLDLGIDMIGFVFCEKSPRNVQQMRIPAGTIPDRAGCQVSDCHLSHCSLIGVFYDDMPQNVITRVYNYHLNYIQLDGIESTTYIDNLRNTIVPDIAPGVKIIKTISISNAADLNRWHDYKGHVDMLLFDIVSTECHLSLSLLDGYDGDIPFLLSGSIGPDDADRIKAFHHPLCIGINIDTMFEDAPAYKNVNKLREFISKLRD